ncbi:ArnT family glycosyltransferase [Palleronia sp. LCG004]|uniref:ArnT family glycosyltransferase n=1 Tax=Palleronia sp. LCG004 TaxID=3079304 RepID=UPI00294370D1|nr:glycosyltransferase family 39 protein [Palleronia sp. LCG004]WOI55711.1 glycosyltransferase family 39 protein [Palleronia sp. LCG004]
MKTDSKIGSPIQGAIAPALIFLAVAFAGVLLRPALPIDETRYLTVAWEMWLGGDLLVPTKNFALYTHKPPLFFWLIQAMWSVTGVSEIAARLVGPLAATATILTTGLLAARLWPDDHGASGRTGWALAGSAVFALSGQLTMFDALLALCAVLTMLAVLAAAKTGERRWWIVAGLALGLGGLAKGPVILIHVLPAMLALPWWAGSNGRSGWRDLPAGLVLAVAAGLGLVALWIVPAGLSVGPEWFDAVLWRQSAGRVTNAFAHARPWWFYTALLPLLLFPWAFLPSVWRQVVRIRWSEPGLRLALVWMLPAMLAFSLISGKQLHYLVPELPAVAIVVGRLLRDVRPRPLLPAIVAGAVGCLLLASASGLVSFGRIDAMLHPVAVVGLVGAGFIGMGIALARFRSAVGTSLAMLGAILGLNLLVGATELGAGYDAGRIAGLLADREEEGIALYSDEYHGEFTFAGRLTKPVAELETASMLAEWADEHPEGLILSRLEDHPLPWRPDRKIAFRGRPYAIWEVSGRKDQADISAVSREDELALDDRHD